MGRIEQWTDEQLDRYIWDGIEPNTSLIEQKYARCLELARDRRNVVLSIIVLVTLFVGGIYGASSLIQRHTRQQNTDGINNLIYDASQGAFQISIGMNPDEGTKYQSAWQPSGPGKELSDGTMEDTTNVHRHN